MSDFSYDKEQWDWPHGTDPGVLALDVCTLAKSGGITLPQAVMLLEYHCGWEHVDAVWAMRGEIGGLGKAIRATVPLMEEEEEEYEYNPPDDREEVTQ